MRALAPLAAFFLLWSGVVSGQSLAETAEKEKERRARTSETSGDGAVPVIGDDELKASRGDKVSVMGREASNIDDVTDLDDDAEKADEHQLSEAEIREYRETWARVWAERLEAAETELELAKDAVFQCQSAAHFVYVPIAVDCNGVFERRAIAEYRVKETRQNRYNWELLLPERRQIHHPDNSPIICWPASSITCMATSAFVIVAIDCFSRGSSSALAMSTLERARLGVRDYRTTTIESLIQQCDAHTDEHTVAIDVGLPIAGVPDDDRPFHPGLDDLFELAIGGKEPGRLDSYRALNEDFKAGYVALVQGNAERAVRFLSSAAAASGSSFVVHLELGRAHSLGGDMESARGALELAERSAPKDNEVAILSSAVNIELGRFEQARERLSSIGESASETPDVSFLTGRALAGLNRDDAALEKFREAVAAEPNFHEAYFEAALVLAKTADHEARFRLLNRACSLAPDEVRYNRELARLVLAEDFDVEAGLAACDRLMVTDEDNAWEYLFWIAQLYIRRGWKREARDPLEKALRLVPPERSADRRAIESCLTSLS